MTRNNSKRRREASAVKKVAGQSGAPSELGSRKARRHPQKEVKS